MLFFSILSILMWGLWGFFGKLATKYNSPIVITAVNNLIAPVFGILLFFFVKNRFSDINLKHPALILIFLVMTAGTFGTLAFYVALSKGSPSIVVTLTALYPAVTIILSVIFLKETFSLIQIVGFVFVIFGALLLNIGK